MKRGQLKRGKPLRRSGSLPRHTRIKARNAKRGGSRFPHRRDPEWCAHIRTLPCAVATLVVFVQSPPLVRPCSGRIECAHVRSRGAGGDDRGNTVPLCTGHHRQQHGIGIQSFEYTYGLDLAAIATELASRSPASPASRLTT